MDSHSGSGFKQGVHRACCESLWVPWNMKRVGGWANVCGCGQTCGWVGKRVGGWTQGQTIVHVMFLISLVRNLRVVWGAENCDTTFSSNLVNSVEI